jgi:hypothetical protein
MLRSIAEGVSFLRRRDEVWQIFCQIGSLGPVMNRKKRAILTFMALSKMQRPERHPKLVTSRTFTHLYIKTIHSIPRHDKKLSFMSVAIKPELPETRVSKLERNSSCLLLLMPMS